ncbi:F0F1 ATP synthase subunit B [Spongiactinospora gelatinilytica]|uniref:ATP synthase subunit b n=1 Tax=Spongiactinospora gelatinilytica TaxID=2666298 RepID=A0A2W2HEN9_9ACTN|nr:F0F1 ATP synthase subunit B [Spongiactinospora gelatinilytica]PZG44667.1 F0F1 ATP synthase subunit B [Spongiactinospora gelatinilytica]
MNVLAEAGGNNPLIPHPAEMAIGGFAFLFVLFFVGRMLVPRIQKTLADRAEAIEGGLKKAADAQKEAQQALDEYREQLVEARHEAARLREEAREQGAQIKAELREEAQAEARRLIEAAHAQIEADRQQAFAQLRAEIGRLSTDLAGRIVGESLEDEARQRRVVDRFLEELESDARQAVR